MLDILEDLSRTVDLCCNRIIWYHTSLGTIIKKSFSSRPFAGFVIDTDIPCQG